MKSLRCVATSLSLGLAVASAHAQTCANPLTINSNIAASWQVFDSCNSADFLDTNWQGSVYTPGRDVVYLVHRLALNRLPQPTLHFTLIPQQPTYDPAIFACSQCNALALCIDGHDDGGPGYTEQMTVGHQIRPYYLIVDSTDSSYLHNCGPYALNIMQN
jgi:hypothetical protein